MINYTFERHKKQRHIKRYNRTSFVHHSVTAVRVEVDTPMNIGGLSLPNRLLAVHHSFGTDKSLPLKPIDGTVDNICNIQVPDAGTVVDTHRTGTIGNEGLMVPSTAPIPTATILDVFNNRPAVIDGGRAPGARVFKAEIGAVSNVTVGVPGNGGSRDHSGQKGDNSWELDSHRDRDDSSCLTGEYFKEGYRG